MKSSITPPCNPQTRNMISQLPKLRITICIDVCYHTQRSRTVTGHKRTRTLPASHQYLSRGSSVTTMKHTVAPVLDCLSLPARSTRFNLPTRITFFPPTPLISIVIIKIAWERELCSFMLVALQTQKCSTIKRNQTTICNQYTTTAKRKDCTTQFSAHITKALTFWHRNYFF